MYLDMRVYGCPHVGLTIGGIVYYVCRGDMDDIDEIGNFFVVLVGGGIELYGLSY